MGLLPVAAILVYAWIYIQPLNLSQRLALKPFDMVSVKNVKARVIVKRYFY